MTDREMIDSDVTLTRDPSKVDCYIVGGEIATPSQSISAVTFLVLAEAHAEVGPARLIELLREIRDGKHTTADDLLAKLAGKTTPVRREILVRYHPQILRAAADLCGVDAEGMSKAMAIRAILENF